MFDAFFKIADQLGEKMQSALPSQRELQESGGSYYDPEKGKRTIALLFGARALRMGDATQALSSASTFSNADYPHLNAELLFQRHNVMEFLNHRSKLPVFLQFSLNGGYGQQTYTRDGKNVPSKLISVEALPAVGYTFVLSKFRIEPYLGFGVGYSRFNFDYSNLTRRPVDTTVAKSVSESFIEQYYTFSQVGAIVKYALRTRIAIMLAPAMTVFHFSTGMQVEIHGRLGVGFYF
ncbi:MAG TPA: hypothetical protein PLY93_03480 [Turneriella sp.]|nr:hypothetical protein [Turneriella sp.]